MIDNLYVEDEVSDAEAMTRALDDLNQGAATILEAMNTDALAFIEAFETYPNRDGLAHNLRNILLALKTVGLA